jgi:hypothetical protein
MESELMSIFADNKEPATTVSALHAMAEIMYSGKRTFRVRSTNLPTGDVRIQYKDRSVLGEIKTVADLLTSRGKRFTDQKQRLSNVGEPTIFVLRGWWGDPTFKCPSCGNQNAYVLCPSCKKPSKFRDAPIKPSDSKSIATMLVELMKLGIPAFSVPDDMLMSYVFFKYLDLDVDDKGGFARYRIVSDISKKTESTYLAALAIKGVGETYAMAIANTVSCPNDIGNLTIDDLTTILKTTRVKVSATRKKPYDLAVSFYNQWHGIGPLTTTTMTT